MNIFGKENVGPKIFTMLGQDGAEVMLSADELGFTSAGGSIEPAKQLLAEIQSGPYPKYADMETLTHLIGMQSAAYKVYAEDVLKVLSGDLASFGSGVMTWHREYLASNGENVALTDTLKFMKYHLIYFGAIRRDSSENRDPSAFVPFSGKLGEAFASLISFTRYGAMNEIEGAEKVYLAEVVADAPLAIFSSLQELKLKRAMPWFYKES